MYEDMTYKNSGWALLFLKPVIIIQFCLTLVFQIKKVLEK